MDDDPYALLGVSIDATPREIDQARKYADRVLREIARGLGPELAAAKSGEIELAWRTLSDPVQRAGLDQRRREALASNPTVSSTFSKATGDPGKLCSLCNASPAMTMHFRVRRNKKTVESISGLFCRTCGIATFRDSTNQTLRQGFWKARTIITTMAIVQGNIRERRRINALERSGETSFSLDPGRPVWLRSGVITLTISISVFLMTVAQVADTGSMLSGKHSPLNDLPLP